MQARAQPAQLAAGKRQRAAVAFGDIAADRNAEPGAGLLVQTLATHAELRQRSRVEPRAIVVDVEVQLARLRAGASWRATWRMR